MQMSEMLVRVMGENVHLVQELDPDLDSVRVDPVQFQQVMLNLVVNARDAMPSGGTIKIKTAHDDGAETVVAGLKNKKQAVISVTDDGCGIEPDTLPHIF